MKKIAILLATYNGEKYIQKQLQSIAEQSVTDFLCIISDDGSNDNTCTIVKSFCEKDPRFIFIKNDSYIHGATGNFWNLMNYALTNTNAFHFFFSDQDDVWLTNKVELEDKELYRIEEKGTEPALVFCDQQRVDGSLENLNSPSRGMLFKSSHNIFRTLVFQNFVPGCTMVINRALLKLCIEYGEPNRIVIHDWWIMLCAISFGKVSYIDEKLMLYRQHGANEFGVRRTRIEKMKKYLFGPTNHWKRRAMQANNCKSQVIMLSQAEVDSQFHDDIIGFSEMTKKNKIYRVYFCLSKRYIQSDNLFTLVFV